MEYAVAHYKFLAKHVDVVGSNKREYFDVTRLPEGDVRVRMYNVNKDGEQGKKMYDRLFKRGQTKSIEIYALGGDDKIKLQGRVQKHTGPGYRWGRC